MPMSVEMQFGTTCWSISKEEHVIAVREEVKRFGGKKSSGDLGSSWRRLWTHWIELDACYERTYLHSK